MVCAVPRRLRPAQETRGVGECRASGFVLRRCGSSLGLVTIRDLLGARARSDPSDTAAHHELRFPLGKSAVRKLAKRALPRNPTQIVSRGSIACVATRPVEPQRVLLALVSFAGGVQFYHERRLLRYELVCLSGIVLGVTLLYV